MPAPDEFITISKPGRAEYRERGSRFFGFAQPVSSDADAEKMRADLRKEYHDAAHQPFAYRLAGGEERSSDDGEPRGTSGPSILAQIQAASLFNAQVVIVRYFGGTKLGKGGLARAFGECAREALLNAGTKTVLNRGFITVNLSPANANTAKGIANQFQAEISSISYGTNAHIRFAVPVSRIEDCRKALLDRFGPEIFEGAD